MNAKTANIISLALILSLLAYVFYIYPNLPDPMPTHWNAAGTPDDYTPKFTGTLILTSIPILMALLFNVIPRISPRGFRTEGFANVLNAMMLASVAFGCLIAVGAMKAGMDPNLDITRVVSVSVGLLFIIIGNFMGKFRKNFFVGIRTPWTLASDEVWVKTHRLGGWCMVVAGLIMASVSFVNIDPTWTIFVVLGFVLIPVVYSYFAYRSLEGFAPDTEDEALMDERSDP